ncbi:MAG: UPF0164 family protein [Spirochaetales bacterium]|nr:UPF0164 family protein [Spirochaetales bacterium]
MKRNSFRRYTRISILILLFLSVSGFSGLHADSADFWNNYFDFSSFFLDENTGLTAFPLLTIPYGGKYEAMGTAFSAIADDHGFFDANPAGSATLAFTELTFSHNAWIADTAIEGIRYSYRRKNLGLGFSGKFLYVPFTEYDSWGESVHSVYYTEGVATLNASYNFFHGYYFRGLSVGTNLKVAYRHIPEVIEENQSAVNVLGDFGLLTRVNFLKFYRARDKNLSVSAVVRNLAPPLGEAVPSEATLGLGYKPVRPVTLGIDVNYPFAFLTSEPAESWNIAAGVDVRIAEFLSAQTGFHYKGGNPRFSLGTALDLKFVRINMNYTLGLDTQVQNPVDRFSLTASMNLGDGGRFDLQQKIDEYYLAGLEAYAKGDFESARKFWEAVLELDGTFEPAQENLLIVAQTLSLQEQLEQLNRVEE